MNNDKVREALQKLRSSIHGDCYLGQDAEKVLIDEIIAALQAPETVGEDTDKAFVRGYAVCLANAVRLESWSPDDIGGGIALEHFKHAGVEKYDLDVLKKVMK